ncbi:HNH endonuclease [Yersinia intermedia]|uniref:HNH endonuclease n=1 Tax=Yersinia intermedia TaxID=631 RepID=UPI0030CB4D07
MRQVENGLLEVAWYLSKYGKKTPPVLLGVDSLKDAILLFYPTFGVGKTEVEFYNSMKNYRDRFDSWLSDVRRGWRNADGSPGDLSLPAIDVMNKMNGLPISLVEQKILYWLSPNPSIQEAVDFSCLLDDENLNETMRERLISARLGQGEFRKNCLKLFPACPVTGIFFHPLLRASHIKPWSVCESAHERLDPYNGIMLAAHIDALFDQGWLSFSNDGQILISTELNNEIKEYLTLPEKISPFPILSHNYLKWHRENILR